MKDLKDNKVLIILASPFYLDKGSCVRARSDIIAWANSFKNIDLLTYPVGNDIPIINVNHIRANIPFYKKVSAGPSISKIYADILLFLNAFVLLIKNKYEIIIGEDFEGGFLSLILTKIFRKVFVYAMYNPLGETLRPYVNKKFFIRIGRRIDNFLEKQAKNITTEWDYELKRIKKLYPKKNISFVPDAFPTERKEVQGFNNRKYIFYSGNFKEYQGIDLLLESFKEYLKKNKDMYLLLAGDKYEEMEEYAKELGIGNRVVFTGSLSLVETNYMIYNSLFCVLPRTVDGPPGMKALHYFSQGKSILGTDLSCNRKVIEDNKSGYLVEPNVEEFSKGIDRMVKDIGFRSKLEEYIRKRGIGSQERANEGVVKLLELFFNRNLDMKDEVNFGNYESNLEFLMNNSLIKKGEKILEIGCGKGKMLNTLLEKGYSICGVELNEEYVKEMKNIYKRDLPVTHVKGFFLPFSDKSFDKVISFDVLEHIPNTKGHLLEVARVLKKGGKYCFGIPNRLTDEPFCIWSAKSFTKYKKPGGHCSLQTYWSIKRKLERNGFEVKFYKQKQNTKWIRNKVFRHFGTNGLRLFNFLRIDKWPIWLKPTIYVTGEKV